LDKATAVQKVREALGIEPVEQHDVAFFELNGVYLCHVSGADRSEESTLGFRHGGVNPDYFDWDRLIVKLKDQLELGRKAANVTAPEGEVTLTDFEYQPGGKWDCGVLNLKADTPLGPFTWEEVVPGPRHGDDHAELTVTLNGVELDLWKHGLELDFEPPNKEGKWADKFADSEGEVAEQLAAWFEANKSLLAVLVS
jgi:hypothetical protein